MYCIESVACLAEAIDNGKQMVIIYALNQHPYKTQCPHILRNS